MDTLGEAVVQFSGLSAITQTRSVHGAHPGWLDNLSTKDWENRALANEPKANTVIDLISLDCNDNLFDITRISSTLV